MQRLTWHALSALLLAMFAITVGYGIVLPILPFLIERIAGIADAASLSWHTGLLTGTYVLAIFLFAPLWGRLSDRWERRPVLLLGLSGFTATTALFMFVESLTQLYLGRFLSGLFAAAITPVAYAVVGDHASSKERRAHRFALINVAGTAGFFIGPLLGGLGLRLFRDFFARDIERAFAVPFLATLVFSPLIRPEFTRWLLTPGLAVLAISLVVMSLTSTALAMSIAVALVAASAGILSPVVTYWVSLGADETQGADLGRATAAASLGQALGSAAGGLLFDVSILPGAAFTGAAIVVLAGLGASIGLPRRLMPPPAASTVRSTSVSAGAKPASLRRRYYSYKDR